MIRNVHLVDELVVVPSLQIALAVVTHATAFLRNFTVAVDQVGVAVGAVHATLEGQIVVKHHAAAEVEILLGDLVAAGACAQPLVEVSFLKMTEEAGRGGDGHVAALHDLGVTTRATESLASPEFLQVRFVVEGDAVEVDFAGQSSRLVAVGAQATRVGDLSGRPRAFATGDVLGKLNQPQQLSPHFLANTRPKVALDATHVLVRRLLPRHEVRFHNVARAAELRTRCVPSGARRQERDEQQKRPPEGGRPKQKSAEFSG